MMLFRGEKRRRSVVVSVVLSLFFTLLAAALPSSADAQRSRNERLGRAAFERGRIAYDAGDYDEALRAFRQAYVMTQRPQLLYNIGLAQDRLRMDHDALVSFESYLENVPDTPYREQVESRITALRAAEARRADQRRELEDARRAEAEAAAAAQAEAEARGEAAAQADEEARIAREEAAEAEAERERAEEEARRARESGGRRSLWWVGVIVGVVVVGAGVGLAVGLSGRDDGFAQSDFGEVTQTQWSF
ncbi:MAG: tetratricopeptide repeat protein [Myxococcota bacterium]